MITKDAFASQYSDEIIEGHMAYYIALEPGMTGQLSGEIQRCLFTDSDIEALNEMYVLADPVFSGFSTLPRLVRKESKE